MTKTTLAALALAASVTGAPAIAGNTLGIAFAGYDPVSYSEGTPKQGEARFFHFWNGAVWYFSTEENRDAFMAEPTAHAPQVDAYCAWAASQGYTRPGDPT